MDSKIQLVTFSQIRQFESDEVEKIVDKKICMLVSKFQLKELEVLDGYYFIELSDEEFDEMRTRINDEMEGDDVLKSYIKVSCGKCI